MKNLSKSQEDITSATKKKSSNGKCCGIYGLRNKVTNKWYIGHSLNIKRRWGTYKRFDCKSQRKLHAALIEYGYDTFERNIIEECPPVSLLERVTYWTKHYDAVNNGYNCKVGGYCASEKSRKKMRDAKLGKPLSDTHKESIKNGSRPITDEQKDKMKLGTHTYNYLKDHPELWTEEFRKKYIESKRRQLKLI